MRTPNASWLTWLCCVAAATLLGAFCCGPVHAEIRTVTTMPVIVDGDTLRLDGVKVRLKGPDTPESFRSRCEAELVVALKAKQRLRELVGDGSGVTWEPDGLDRYGRTLVLVYAADGREVGETLIAEGLAVRWRPGRAAWLERARHWCGPNVELPQ